ncbi:MAG: S41 family peptidase [Candidatus Latescibacterota bacterium]|nr:S41 family peptidase [Candidatus Latescibacterota bacterium]
MSQFQSILCVGILALLPVRSEGATKEPRANIFQQTEALTEVAQLVKRQYYRESDQVDLYHGAIEGYVSKLDPHSTYITPEQLRKTHERLDGAFEGIGIYFDLIDKFLTVLSPIDGSPAHKVGILAGDRIVRIDGKSAVNIKTLDVEDRLKGPKGSKVVVSVQRQGHDRLIEFEITRDKIEVPSVPYAFKVASGVGYVKANRFSSRTTEEIREAVKELLKDGAQRLILDLRGNGGGFLEQAVSVSDLFLETDRLVVYTEGRRRGSREDHYSRRDPLIPATMPVICLVNSSSASASEIVAGALQDYDRGLIVGHTTFGKGLVQKQYRLKNGGAILLTVAKYMTPSGRPIQRPYDKGKNSYLEAGHDNYDPNSDPDSTSAKPIYYTEILHREVYGSGGISPDVVLSSDSLSVFERRLLQSGVFLEFATKRALDFSESYSDFNSYFEKYRPGRREMTAFRKFIKSLSEDRISISSDERLFRDSTDFIKRNIRQQFAQIRWGTQAAGRVRIDHDPVVDDATGLFERAIALLDSRTYHNERRQGSGSGAVFGKVR